MLTRKFRMMNMMLIFIVLLTGSMIYGKKSVSAASNYSIKINKQQNCVTIYKKSDNGEDEAYKAMVCSVGNDTPIGTFALGEKMRWHELDGPCYGQYCTRITGHILFHSVWYFDKNNPATLSNYQYNRLGTTASHGCVRLCTADAKWVYENCPSGTSVEIYNSSNPGPLGKPSAIKLPEGRGWDPTDTTNPNNPYNNKKPTITLNKNADKIKFASDFKLFKAVSVKNTVGLDASARTQYKISYKTSKGWKTISSINAKKPGKYKVSLSITDELGRTAKKTVSLTVSEQIKMKKIVLNTNEINMTVKKSKKLKVEYYPKNVSINTLKIWSSNTSVCKVNKKGIIKAVGEGKATIYVKALDGSGVIEKCKIYVKKKVSTDNNPQKNDSSTASPQPIVENTTPPDNTSSDVSTQALGIR